jgi:hypothetical protein
MVAKYPALPEPTIKVDSIRDTVLSIKQAFEILTGQRGNPAYRAVLLPEITEVNARLDGIDADIAAINSAITTINATLSKVVRVDVTQSFTDAEVTRGLWNIRQGTATQLAVGADLNTLFTPGLYDGTSLVNAPDASWYYVEVFRHSNWTPTNEWTVQRITHLTNPNGPCYIRASNNAGTWGAWKSFTLT